MVDTLHSATYGSNENSTLDAGVVLKAIKYAQKELGCAVLLVHHSNRAGTGERGSSAYRGAMDVILEIAGNGDGQVMKCSKMKDGAPFKPIAFSLVAKEDSARVSWDGFATENAAAKTEAQDEILALLKSNQGVKFKATRVANELEKSRTAAGNALKKLCDGGRIQRELQPDDSFLYWYQAAA